MIRSAQQILAEIGPEPARRGGAPRLDRTCTETGCTGPHHSRGRCKPCYDRMLYRAHLRGGLPLEEEL